MGRASPSRRQTGRGKVLLPHRVFADRQRAALPRREFLSAAQFQPWFRSLSFLETSGFAGGLVQFDSSGDGPIRERVVGAVSPHPDPLPQGEGTARTAQRKPKGLDGTSR